MLFYVSLEIRQDHDGKRWHVNGAVSAATDAEAAELAHDWATHQLVYRSVRGPGYPRVAVTGVAREPGAFMKITEVESGVPSHPALGTA